MMQGVQVWATVLRRDTEYLDIFAPGCAQNDCVRLNIAWRAFLPVTEELPEVVGAGPGVQDLRLSGTAEERPWQA
jgi:hypothetical protein